MTTEILERPQTRKWTYDEIAQINDDVRRELYDGEIFEMPRTTARHQNTIGQIMFALAMWAKKHGGRVLLSPLDLWISAHTVLIPDLMFFSATRSDIQKIAPDDQRIVLVPDVVVEVLCDQTRRNDRFSKMRAYADFGVANYWILDPEIQTLEAFELQNGVYQTAAFLENGETFSPVALPELSIELARVFDL